MLGRSSYTREELDHARAAIAGQLAAYTALAEAVEASSDTKALAALAAFEPLFLHNMTIVLDRLFVHRVRSVSGKNGNPLNEVELLVESLMGNDGVLRGNNVIKLVPAQTVVGLEPGERITLDLEQFSRLSQAYLDELETRFVTPA